MYNQKGLNVLASVAIILLVGVAGWFGWASYKAARSTDAASEKVAVTSGWLTYENICLTLKYPKGWKVEQLKQPISDNRLVAARSIIALQAPIDKKLRAPGPKVKDTAISDLALSVAVTISANSTKKTACTECGNVLASEFINASFGSGYLIVAGSNSARPDHVSLIGSDTRVGDKSYNPTGAGISDNYNLRITAGYKTAGGMDYVNFMSEADLTKSDQYATLRKIIDTIEIKSGVLE